MYQSIENSISRNDIPGALEECVKNKKYYTGLFLSKLLNHPYDKFEELISNSSLNDGVIKIKLLCDWCSSKKLADLWNKMSQGDYRWNNIEIIWEDHECPDYYVVINMPPAGTIINKKKTILFRMEPNMEKNQKFWKEWSDPRDSDFLKIYRHENDYNNNEWHLSKSYSELSKMNLVNKTNCISTVLTAKYTDPGHVKRVDFVKFLEKKMDIDVFGENRWQYKNYKGSLPYHCKDDAIFPYKYTFNVENFSIKNYYTEKLIDGILGECLVFYSGCPNIKDFIDERAYVYLELSNFEKDYGIIQKAIREDWQSKRLPYIRQAKYKILNELQFFPRLEKFLTSIV
jgi:hypothetical protein